MALSDLLLLAAILLVLAILGAGGYVLMFQKRFSFLKRPYPETGVRLSKRLGIPTDAPADAGNETMEITGEHSGAAVKIPEFATGVMEIARDLTPADQVPSITKGLVIPGVNCDPADKTIAIAGEHPEAIEHRSMKIECPGEGNFNNSLYLSRSNADERIAPAGGSAGAGRSPGTLSHHISEADQKASLETSLQTNSIPVIEETGMEIAGEFPVEGPEPFSFPPIPWSYDECKITALVRDPYWLFTYWEVNDAKREEIARRYGLQAWDESWPVLRVYDATNLYFFDSRHYSEISINDYANNWYIRTGQPNRTFCIELGRVRPDGSYIFLARSNFVTTPRDQVSDVIDEEWLLLPEYATRLYQRIGGIYPGPSSPGSMGPAEYISSPGFMGQGGPSGEISSPMKWQ
jgi:hypothetical protein